MNLAKLIFVLLLLVSPLTVTASHSLTGDDEVEIYLYEISRDMADHFIITADHIDSLRATLSDRELETYQSYFDYTDAYVALVKEDHNKSFFLAERALEHFMYSGENEWACRCLKLIAHTAIDMRLMPEAAKLYKRIVDTSKDPYILGASYLNMSWLRKSIGLEWKEQYKLGVYYNEQTGDANALLNSSMVSYWLHPDSSDMGVNIPLLAEKFHALEHYTREADAYKCLVFHYLNAERFTEALFYVNKSIHAYNTEERPARLLLASIHFLKGNILLHLKRKEDAYVEYNTALDINAQSGNKSGNYSLYKSMYKSEYKEENYKEACFFLEKSTVSYEYISRRRMEYYTKMTTVFRKIKVIEEELMRLKRKAAIKTILISLLLVTFFSIIILWLLSLKHSLERKSVDMQGKNTKLKVEAGELLLKSNRNKLTSKIITSQSDVERKMKKFLSQNEVLPDIIKDKYADTMLSFDVKLPMLSDTEKRYAVMIALDIPIKSIAELLNVKPETVAQYRNRLRKKLGIVNTDTELNAYLKTFLEE